MSKLRIDKNKCLQRSWTGKMAYGILTVNWSWRFKHGILIRFILLLSEIFLCFRRSSGSRAGSAYC